jgi:hypothetical protein
LFRILYTQSLRTSIVQKDTLDNNLELRSIVQKCDTTFSRPKLFAVTLNPLFDSWISYLLAIVQKAILDEDNPKVNLNKELYNAH